MANIIKTTLEDANDVLTYSKKASFPSSGESGKLYIAADTKYTYFWNGSSYVETRGSGYASSSHTHDDRYYTESEVDSKLGSKANSSEVVKKSGDTMTGNLEFSSISYSNAPVSSKGLTWRGGTDAAEIFYRLDANDTGRLVFKTHDDDNCNFVWENSIQGQWMNLSKNGTLAVKGDITSNGNKVALDKDVVKLTGNQTISGIKSFSNKIINTYIQHGVMDIHPENNGTIISYYTNDLGYLFERGGSCVATNITQNKTITVPADAFDCSPSYWYLSLNSTSDVVQILIKTPQTYTYGTRGGIGFGANAWRAKDVKIEVGYSATNTGNASSPDTDIHWVTKINLTGQGEGLVCENITGPNTSEGGNSSNSWSYMRLTLTNWATVNPRIAQIFSVTYNSRGLHNAFLSKNGGYVYGNILPSNNNRYLGNGSENWAAVYARYFYENGTSLADKYAAKTIKLSDNVNLDTVNSSGFYRLMNMSSNTNFSHSQMIVSRGDDTIAQMVFPYGDTRMYVRTGNPFNTSGGLWHDWKQVAFTDNINNPKITIKQGGTEKGSFTLNQSGGTTIELTDNNTKYSAGTGLSLNSSNNTFSVKTGYTTNANNRNYKVAADSNGNLYVNVPWSSSGTLDTSLDSSSTNALQNKAIYSAFSSAIGYDNNYYTYGATGSWRIRQYNATGNSLDIRYGVIAINSQSTNYSVSFGNGKKFTSTNYIVVFGLYRSNAQSWFWSPIVQSKTESGFTVFLRGNSSGDNSGTIMYLAIRSN